MHADYTDDIDQIPLDLFRELAYCEYPLYVPLKAPEELSQLRNLSCARRVDYHSSTLLSGTRLPRGVGPQLADYCHAVARKMLTTIIAGVRDTGLLPRLPLGIR